MTYTDKAKRWLDKQFPNGTPSIGFHHDQAVAVLAFAQFLDGEEERKFGDFVDMLSGAPRKEEKPVCEHERGVGANGPGYSNYICKKCGVLYHPPQVVEELDYERLCDEACEFASTKTNSEDPEWYRHVQAHIDQAIIKAINSLSKR